MSSSMSKPNSQTTVSMENALQFPHAKTDPITGRRLSDNCWNNQHGKKCVEPFCDCMCHDCKRKKSTENKDIPVQGYPGE